MRTPEATRPDLGRATLLIRGGPANSWSGIAEELGISPATAADHVGWLINHGWAIFFRSLCLMVATSTFVTAAESIPAAAATARPAEAAAFVHQAREHLSAKRWNEAIAAATKAIEDDPTCWTAYIVRAAAHHGLGNFDAGIADCDQVTKQEANDAALQSLRSDAFVQRSRSQYAQGKYLAAVDSGYFAILQKPDNVDAMIARGLAYLARHEWDKAIRTFDRAIRTDPKSAEAYSHRGYGYGCLGRLDQVITDQNKAIELDPLLAIAYERRGAALAMQNKFPEAIKDIDKALELDPGLGEALCDRATILRLNGDLVRAAAEADAAIKATPGLARAHVTRGMIWAAGRERDLKKSRQCFEEAVRLDPKNTDALCGLGQCHLADGEHEPAIAAFSKAIELAPEMMAAYVGRAEARKKLGAIDDSRADLAKIKELKADADPSNKNKAKPKPAAEEPPLFRVTSKPVNPARHGEAMASARKIDQLVAANYAKHGVTPMPRTTDEEFVRRIHLDVAGRIPTLEEMTSFLASTDPDKRTKLIDTLLGSDDYASHAFNYWADVLRYRDWLGNVVRGEYYRQWIKQSLAENKPWDRFVSEMLSAEGLIWESPATGYLQRDREMPLDNVNNTVRIFLGTRIGCAQCHNHPFDKWTQMQFYQAAAFFHGYKVWTGSDDKRYWNEDHGRRIWAEYAQIEQEEEDRRAKAHIVGGQLGANTAILNDSKNLWTQLPKDYAYSDAKPGDRVEPKVPFGQNVVKEPNESHRAAFARWLTAKDNPRFALTIANRLWKQLFGAGQIEPVDDMNDDTVAENPELMAFLEAEMKRLDFDMKEYLRILLNTETYQRQAFDKEVALGSPYHFPGPILRRMTAEQVWDSLLMLAIPNAGYREPAADIFKQAWAEDLATVSAAELIEADKKWYRYDLFRKTATEKHMVKGVLLGRASELPSPLPPNHFLRMFGQSDRELISASSTDGSVTQVLFMFNGDVAQMMIEPNSAMRANIVTKKGDSDRVKVIFLSILSREPDEREMALALEQVKSDGPEGYRNVVWSLVNTREFLFVQ